MKITRIPITADNIPWDRGLDKELMEHLERQLIAGVPVTVVQPPKGEVLSLETFTRAMARMKHLMELPVQIIDPEAFMQMPLYRPPVAVKTETPSCLFIRVLPLSQVPKHELHNIIP